MTIEQKFLQAKIIIGTRGLPENMIPEHKALYLRMTEDIVKYEHLCDPRADIVRDNRFALLCMYRATA